jgi:hypothetical protein
MVTPKFDCVVQSRSYANVVRCAGTQLHVNEGHRAPMYHCGTDATRLLSTQSGEEHTLSTSVLCYFAYLIVLDIYCKYLYLLARPNGRVVLGT